MIRFFDWLVTDNSGFAIVLVIVGVIIFVKLLDAVELLDQ